MNNTPAKLAEVQTDASEESIELRSDGEQRFRAAVHAAAKSGPKHRPAKDDRRR